MYEQSAKWNEYYRELEPKRRRAMLDALSMTEPDDGAKEYRQRLFRARHVDEKSPGREVDRYLFACISFIQLANSAKLFKRSAAKEVDRTLAELLMDAAPQYGEAGERALYWEIRNAAMRYLKTCEGSGYNRKLFGMVASGDDSRQDRVCRDVWQMTLGLARRADREAQLALWSRAVLDAYAMADGDGPKRLEEYDRRMSEGRRAGRR